MKSNGANASIVLATTSHLTPFTHIVKPFDTPTVVLRTKTTLYHIPFAKLIVGSLKYADIPPYDSRTNVSNVPLPLV